MIYEALFIIKPDLSKEEQDKVVEFITSEITKQNGKIKESNELEKKPLNYDIKNYKEGIYYLITFEVPSDIIKVLKHAYKLNSAILRNLILNKGK